MPISAALARRPIETVLFNDPPVSFQIVYRVICSEYRIQVKFAQDGAGRQPVLEKALARLQISGADATFNSSLIREARFSSRCVQ